MPSTATSKGSAKRTLGIMASPRAKRQLCSNIPSRLYRKYVSDPQATPPPVKLFTAAQARARGATQMTGWYDFAKVEIGLIVDDAKPVRQEMERLEAIDVHEVGHNLFNVWPEGEDSIGHFLDNVFTDASNEQRFILECPYARDKLRKGRLQVLKLYLDDPSAYRGSGEPFYNAAWLTLAAHTVLSVEKRKKGKLTALENLYRGKLNAAEVWPAIEEVIGPPDDIIRDKWLEAFQIAVNAWIARLPEPQAELRKQFRALFPEPQCPPPPSLFDFGGDHESEGTPGAPAAPAQKPGGKPKPPSTKPQPQGRGDDDGDDGPPPPPPPPTPPVKIEIPDKIGGDGDEDEEASDENEAQQDGAESVEDEVESINKGAVAYCPKAPPKDQYCNRDGGVGNPEEISPADPTMLIAECEVPAGKLAELLRVSLRPEVFTQTEYGHVDTYVIATEPDAESPFFEMRSETANATVGSYTAMVLDTSSSTSDNGKWLGERKAGMIFHLAMELIERPYSLVTSRCLRLLAGEGFELPEVVNRAVAKHDTARYVPFRLDPVRAAGLIANLWEAIDSGDNYDVTIPILLEAMSLRPEPAKALLIVTDGGINEEKMIANLAYAESRNIVTVGVGLDLEEGEQEAMRRIFGDTRLVLATSDDFVDPLAETVSAAMDLSLDYASA